MKKALKIAGNILMLAAIAFLVKKFIDMDISIEQMSSPNVITAIAIGFAVQTGIVIVNTFPWLMFTQALSGTKIPFRQAVPIFTRSNLYKYVPGNVFQYIGRNQLATERHISHVDVACATILDIFFCVFATGIVSVLLLGSAIIDLLAKYGQRFLLIGGLVLVIISVMAIIISIKFRKQFREYLTRYSKAFDKQNFPKLLSGALYYFLQNAVSAAMYFSVLNLVFDRTVESGELLTLTGAFMFAWIIGFITPGAPGGIGIRESVMMFICGSKFEDQILLFVLIMRISSIIADILSFSIVSVYDFIRKGKAAADR